VKTSIEMSRRERKKRLMIIIETVAEIKGITPSEAAQLAQSRLHLLRKK
jgi:hypothetical protein